MQLPLLSQALIQLGCVASVKPNVALAQRGRPSGYFDLDDLQSKATAECAYLSSDTNLHRLYLYHRQAATCAIFARKSHLGRWFHSPSPHIYLPFPIIFFQPNEQPSCLWAFFVVGRDGHADRGGPWNPRCIRAPHSRNLGRDRGEARTGSWRERRAAFAPGQHEVCNSRRPAAGHRLSSTASSSRALH